MTIRDGGMSLVGTVLGASGGVPVRTEYRVFTDGAGLTTAAHVRDYRGFEQRTLALARDPKGNWTVDGIPARELRGCTDVDLGCSPATNTLPIRRLRLAVGSTHTIRVAWVRFPELTVGRAEQSYSRLDEFTYRYASVELQAELPGRHRAAGRTPIGSGPYPRPPRPPTAEGGARSSSTSCPRRRGPECRVSWPACAPGSGSPSPSS
jgi:hypothetical protein